jgi:hypothetical protein
MAFYLSQWSESRLERVLRKGSSLTVESPLGFFFPFKFFSFALRVLYTGIVYAKVSKKKKPEEILLIGKHA